MTESKTILFVFGTRPEAIKFAPLILALKQEPEYNVCVCLTAQHREMVDQVLQFFHIKPDYDLNLMLPNQTLPEISALLLVELQKVLIEVKPSLVFVQGDTTTVWTAALSAYYLKIKVAHLEAGLRSNDKFAPFPEEINRIITTHLADIHFAPTFAAVKNLEKENIFQSVYMVGNTVVDALLAGRTIIENNTKEYNSRYPYINQNHKSILITSHRRESFGEPFQNICSAIKTIAIQNPEIQLIYPVHLNPNIRLTAFETLNGIDNIHLIEPVPYADLLWLLNNCYLVITDSGGIQEEAPSFGKPVLIIRDVTERMEGIEAGNALLVGTNSSTIVQHVRNLLDNKDVYARMSKINNPYGDGKTAQRIIEILKKKL